MAVRAVSVGYPRREDIPGRSAPHPGADAPPACSRLMELADPADQGKSLIREYGSNFTAAFDTIPGPVPGTRTLYGDTAVRSRMLIGRAEQQYLWCAQTTQICGLHRRPRL